MTILLLLLLLMVSPVLAGERPVSPMLWEASPSYSLQTFPYERQEWQEYAFSIKRRFNRGAAIGEFRRVRRYGEQNDSAALDAYADLWERSYANVRFQSGREPTFLPETDVLAELFQAVPYGFEFSAFYRHTSYVKDKVDNYGFSVGKYSGRWYLRERSVLIPIAGAVGTSHSLLARFYLREPDDYLQAQAGFGQEIIELGPDRPVENRPTEFYSLKVKKFFFVHYGIAITGTYNKMEKVPPGRELTIETMYRW